MSSDRRLATAVICSGATAGKDLRKDFVDPTAHGRGGYVSIPPPPRYQTDTPKSSDRKAMGLFSSLRNLSFHVPLPSAAELDAANFESYSPYPEFGPYHSRTATKSPKMSSAWVTSFFKHETDHPDEAMLSEKTRRSADVESNASTDASTLLDEERINTSKESTSAAAAARVVSDAIIGLSDGLTVPFALTAGLSALGDTRLVIYGGVAELIAGAISMGLGGYLAAKSEDESYHETYRTTQREVDLGPSASAQNVRETLAEYDLPEYLLNDLVAHLTKSPKLLPFLMQFHHNMPEAAPSRAITCALTIAAGYFLGGFIPLVPYFLVARTEVMQALYWSLAVMALALFAFGYGKTCFVSGWKGRANIWKGSMGGLQMMVIGGIAAACAMGLVRLFNSFAEG